MPGKPDSKFNDSNRNIQITVAALGLFGVLGAALISNWDKFGSRPGQPVTSPASTPQSAVSVQPVVNQASAANSPVVAGVTGNVTINMATPHSEEKSQSQSTDYSPFIGTWNSDTVKSAHGRGDFRVQIHIEQFGDDLIGNVFVYGQEPGRGQSLPLDILDLQVQGTNINFKTKFFGPKCQGELYSIQCDGDAEGAMDIYSGKLKDGSLYVTRHSNLPGGETPERFIAFRK